MKNSQKISVVAPLFNEEKSVGFLHQELLLALKSFSNQVEIIMVDDGSKDGTFEKLKSFQSQRQVEQFVCGVCVNVCKPR